MTRPWVDPASGAAGHARSLARLLDDVQIASRALARARLADEQLEELDALRRMCTEARERRSPIEAADREDEFSEWRLAHHIDPVVASALATANVSLAALDHLARVLPAETLGVAIRPRPRSGTGLGLDIARRFAHLDACDREFTSQPGHTVFRVRLPVAGTKA